MKPMQHSQEKILRSKSCKVAVGMQAVLFCCFSKFVSFWESPLTRESNAFAKFHGQSQTRLCFLVSQIPMHSNRSLVKCAHQTCSAASTSTIIGF